MSKSLTRSDRSLIRRKEHLLLLQQPELIFHYCKLEWFRIKRIKNNYSAWKSTPHIFFSICYSYNRLNLVTEPWTYEESHLPHWPSAVAMHGRRWFRLNWKARPSPFRGALSLNKSKRSHIKGRVLKHKSLDFWCKPNTREQLHKVFTAVLLRTFPVLGHTGSASPRLCAHQDTPWKGKNPSLKWDFGEGIYK